MRRTIILGLLICLMAMPAMAISYSGSLDAGDNTLNGVGAWVGQKTELNWTVAENSGIWNYEYKFEVSKPFVNFFVLEVAQDFTTDSIFNLTVNGGAVNPATLEIGLFTPDGEPGGNIFGIKFDMEEFEELDEIEIIFDSDRDPVWGDMYAEGTNEVDRILTKKQRKAAKKAAKLASKLAAASQANKQVKLEKKLEKLLAIIGENQKANTHVWNNGFSDGPNGYGPNDGFHSYNHILRPDHGFNSTFDEEPNGGNEDNFNDNSAVPEPAGLMMLGLGAILFRRRRA